MESRPLGHARTFLARDNHHDGAFGVGHGGACRGAYGVAAGGDSNVADALMALAAALRSLLLLYKRSA